MSLKANLETVSTKCLHGRPVPRGLEVLWAAQEAGDTFLEKSAWLELLTSQDRIEEYLAVGADGDASVQANLKAMRQMHERLGFFATEDEQDLVAFDFGTGSPDDPPVVKLDTEGQYDWHGANLAEAVFRFAEDRGHADEARAWLAAHGLPLGNLGELGSTTQFFPDLTKYRDRLFYEYSGDPKPPLTMSSRPADPANPVTWLLRPGLEVHEAIARFLNLPAGSFPAVYCAWCDGDGLITQIKIPPGDSANSLTLGGVKLGMTQADVSKLLGPAAATGKVKTSPWLAYEIENCRLRIGFNNGVVAELSLGLPR